MVSAELIKNVKSQEKKQAAPGLEKFVKALDKGNEQEAALVIMLSGLQEQQCGICGGRGHTANFCSTKKNMDTAVSKMPALRMIWGSLKSKYKASGPRVGSKRAASEALPKQLIKDKEALAKALKDDNIHMEIE